MPARSPFCTFYLADQCFGVSVQDVQEILRGQDMTRVPLAAPVVRGLINLRGQIVVALDLRRRLNMAEPPEENVAMNVVLRASHGTYSLLVDQIGAVVAVAEELLEPPPETIAEPLRGMIHGICKLESGLVTVLNTEKILDLKATIIT